MRYAHCIPHVYIKLSVSACGRFAKSYRDCTLSAGGGSIWATGRVQSLPHTGIVLQAAMWIYACEEHVLCLCCCESQTQGRQW
jgi:hypothetical protein